MKFDKVSIILYMIITPLYFTQGWIFESGSKISQSLVLIWMLINMYYLFVSYKLCITRFGKILRIFGLLCIIYWLFSPKIIVLDGINMSTLGELKNILLVLWSYFPFSYWFRKEYISEKYLLVFVVCTLLSDIIAFNVKQNQLIDFYFNRDDYTNNIGYMFPLLFPFACIFFDRKKIIYILLSIIISFTLLSAKRGAILCVVLEVCLFIYFEFKNIPRKKIIELSITLTLLIISGICVCYKYISQNEYLFSRFMGMIEGDSSGRDQIYNNIYMSIYNSNVEYILLGHGMFQTVTQLGYYAHNDWLEIFYDFGFLGFLIYLSIFKFLFVFFVKNRKHMCFRNKCIYLCAVSCLFFKSIVSMGFNAPEAFLIFPSIAFVESTINNKYKLCNL